MFKKHGGKKLTLHVNEMYKSDYRRNYHFFIKAVNRINEDTFSIFQI